MKSPFQFLAFLFLVIAAACSPAQDGPVEFNPTVVVDEICAGLLNNTFQTRTAVQTGEVNGETYVAPLSISFLLDGRLVWNYENNQSYIGTFDCAEGRFTGVFEEGSQTSLEGVYLPEEGTVTIDGDVYLVVKEL